MLCVLMFSLEIGYKFNTRQTSSLLTPYLPLSFVNIWLLAATPTPTTRKGLRFVLSVLHVPVTALVFPEIYRLKLPGEVLAYYTQASQLNSLMYPSANSRAKSCASLQKQLLQNAALRFLTARIANLRSPLSAAKRRRIQVYLIFNLMVF
jgi:hypothetical protein